MSAPESVGVELTEAEIRTAYLAEYSHAKVRDRYDADLLMAGFADGARWLAARQAPTVLDREAVTGATMAHYPSAWLDEGNAPILCRCGVRLEARAYARHLADAVLDLPGVTQAPTVALDVETVARIHFDASARLAAREVGLNEPVAWTDLSDADRQHLRDSAAAIVAADPRRTEAEVKAEARKRIALAIADSVPYNCELRHDGTEDPIAAAYVQALGDAIRITEGATDE